jgi:hypothetical protein
MAAICVDNVSRDKNNPEMVKENFDHIEKGKEAGVI